MTALTRKPIGETSALGAMIAAYGLGMMSFMALPLMLGSAIAQLGITENAAGRVGSVQLGAMTAGALWVAGHSERLNWRKAAPLALAMAVLGNLLAMGSDGLYGLMGARILNGLGEGAMLAMANSAAAGTEKPQKTFSLLTISVSFFFLAVALGAPMAVERFGPQGVFGLMAGFEILCAPWLFMFPSRCGDQEDSAFGFPLTARVLACLSAVALVQMGQAALWAFNQRIGLHVGLSLKGVGGVLGLTAVLTMVGPIAARLLGMRWGKSLPICLSFAFLGAGGLLLAHAESAVVYGIGSIMMPVSGLFGSPYTMSILALLDRRGRVAAAAPAFIGLGDSLGPLAGSFVLTGDGYRNLGWLTLCLFGLSLALILKTARRVDRGASL